jgi:hypothetical protein
VSEKKTIAQHMADVLNEEGLGFVMWGDCWLLDECYSRHRVGPPTRHPLDRHQLVLAALERSKLFEKGYVEVDIGLNNQRRLVRSFKLLRRLS